MRSETGGKIDVLDLVARRHRTLQHGLRELAEEQEPTALDLDRFAQELLCEESLKRVLLHPLLARTSDGERAVERRRDEQHLLVRQTARAIALAGEEDRGEEQLAAALQEMYRTLIGHTDREELEDSPRLRELSTQRELADLAVAHGRLEEVIEPIVSDAVRGMPETDPLIVLETEIERHLHRSPSGRG